MRYVIDTGGGGGAIRLSGFCCVVCLQRCARSISRLSVDGRRTGV